MSVEPSGIVTILTDFGAADGYAGAVKGVLLSQAPGVTIVDITHDIPPFNIRSAAYVLSSCYGDFPPGTVHLAVVDPGVGSERKPVAVYFRDHWFVAPDNGTLSLALAAGGAYDAYEIVSVKHPRGEVSATFHGRDIFAPAAAHLAAGRPPAGLGPKINNLVILDAARPEVHGRRIASEVIHVDRFGNLITGIRADLIAGFTPAAALVQVASYTIIGISTTYADREPGELVAYIGSAGLLEIGIVRGNAATHIKTPVGRSVTVIARDGKEPRT